MVLAMGADFLQRAAAVNLSVARDVEVVADVAEAAADVLAAAVVKAQAHALGRGRAVNDDKRDDSHRPMQELKPNTPARAVATATMVLRTMPHTDFDFVLMLFGFYVKTSVQGIILTDFLPRRRRRRVCFHCRVRCRPHCICKPLSVGLPD